MLRLHVLGWVAKRLRRSLDLREVGNVPFRKPLTDRLRESCRGGWKRLVKMAVDHEMLVAHSTD